MKKLFLLFTLLMFSCSSDSTTDKKEKINWKYIQSDLAITEITYNGHLYVVCDGIYAVALEHSPNCHCFHKQQ